MRRLVIVVWASMIVIGSAQAGLYVPGQPCDFMPKDGKVDAQSFDQFRLHLSDLVGIAVNSPQPTELRRRYLAKSRELKATFDRLTAEELIVLGGYEYRLFDQDGALSAWLKASRLDRRNFAALSNLALLKLAQGDLRDARLFDSDARQLQPRQLPGMTPEQSVWYLKVEGKLRQLIRGRLDEQLRRIPPEQLTPDDLFGVQFAGESGAYEAGRMASTEKQKVPDDALAIVQQLLLWLPHDSRLYWLLGELYNADGNPVAALSIMNECVDPRRFQPNLLREHRQVLQEHFDRIALEEQSKEAKKRQMFWAAVIGGSVLALGLVGWQAWIIIRRFVRA